MKKIIFFIFIFTLFSCEKSNKFNITAEKKILANCIFSPDSLWKVNVSETLSPTDVLKFQSLSNANVEIYKNDTFLYKLNNYIIPSDEFKFPYYTNTNNFVPNDLNAIYKIKISRNDNTISAKAIIPQKPIIKKTELLDIKIDAVENGNGYTVDGTVKLTISDNVLEKNYYSINFFYIATSEISSNNPEEYIDTIFINELNYSPLNSDPSIEDYFIPSERANILINDSLFNGQDKTFTFDISSGVNFKKIADFDKFWIVLKSLNSDNYLYRKSLYKQYLTINDPYSEAVFVHSNFNNSVGIFASYNINTDTVFVSKFQK